MTSTGAKEPEVEMVGQHHGPRKESPAERIRALREGTSVELMNVPANLAPASAHPPPARQEFR